MSYSWINFENLTFLIEIIKMFFIIICSYITFLKILNIKRKLNAHLVFTFLILLIIAIFSVLIKINFSVLMHIICLIFFGKNFFTIL